MSHSSSPLKVMISYMTPVFTNHIWTVSLTTRFTSLRVPASYTEPEIHAKAQAVFAHLYSVSIN